MKLTDHEIERGWRLALECSDPVERVLRVRCGVKTGHHSFASSSSTAALSSVAELLKQSASYCKSLPTHDSDSGLDWYDRSKVMIERFVQACRDGIQRWPHDSPIGVLPTVIRLSVMEAELGWEIVASVPDPVERAIRLRCGVLGGYNVGVSGANVVLALMIHLIKGSAQEPEHDMSTTAANVEAFVASCRSGIKTWPYDSPIGVMPDWTYEVAVDAVMRS